MVAIQVTDSANSVEKFIQSLALPQKIAEGVFFCEDDCKTFYNDFYGKNHNVVDDLLDYREDRINKSNITVDIFLELCYNKDMLDVFTKTFYQSFTLADMVIINKAVAFGRTTLEEIFLDFQKNPNKNILKNVL